MSAAVTSQLSGTSRKRKCSSETKRSSRGPDVCPKLNYDPINPISERSSSMTRQLTMFDIN